MTSLDFPFLTKVSHTMWHSLTHRPRVTDFVVYPPTGSKAYVRKMTNPPTLDIAPLYILKFSSIL